MKWAATVLGSLWAVSALGGEVAIERVIGPEFPGRYKHPATIAELANGDLYIAYYGGAGEYESDTAVYGMRLVKGSRAWTKPQIIADTPSRSDGNAAVWQAPDGVVWLFYVTNYGPTWSHARVKYKISKDGGHTWSDSDMLAFEAGSMARSRPIVLSDGDYLLPLYHETGEDRERTAADTCSYFLRYNQKTKTWTPTNRIYSKIGNLQASPVEIDKDYLVAYIRRGGGFGPMPDGVLYRSESRDGGRTWSPGKETQFKNPNSAADFIKLKNGHLLLVFNDNNEGERRPLTVAISTDHDKSYPYRRDIVDRPDDEFAYPSAIQTQDGKVHVVYTSHERTVIEHAVFDESYILESKPAGP
jgi:predicted neuraminidase